MFLPAAKEDRVGSEGRNAEVPAGLGQGKHLSLLHMVLQASPATLRHQTPLPARMAWPALGHMPDPKITQSCAPLSKSLPPPQTRLPPGPAWTPHGSQLVPTHIHTTAQPQRPGQAAPAQRPAEAAQHRMPSCLPPQAHSSCLRLDSAFWKHLHLPENTH